MNSGFKLGFVILVFAAVGCATIVTPSGGPKDVSPPRVTACQPANHSIDFVADEVKISFDEYVKIKDVTTNLIVSPPLLEKPEVGIKGKSILVKFNEDLYSDATYTLNFGEAIRDITEDNILSNFQYVFSTGSFIDSLQVTGIVKDAFSQENAPGVLVLLYACNEWVECDSLPYKQRPSYYTITDKTGQFSIYNVKDGSYLLFALQDANRNFMYDLPNELIGFVDHIIHAGDSMMYPINLFEEAGEQKLLRVKSKQKGRIDVALKHSAKNLRINAMAGGGKKAWEIIEFSNQKDSITYWNNIGADTIELHVFDETSGFRDTLRIGQGKEHPDVLSISSNIGSNSILDLNKAIQLRLSSPVPAPNLNQLVLMKKADSVRFDTLQMEIEFNDPAMRSIEISHDFIESGIYQLFIPSKCMRDMFGNVNDSLRLPFSIRPLSFYGNAKIEIELPDLGHSYLVQLYNAGGNIIRENHIVPDKDSVNQKRTFEYQYLPPGTYGVRIIEDVIGNAKWDAGKFLSKELPENVFYYPDDITIRSNWDVVLDWKVGN